MTNVVVLIGRLTRDVEMRTTTSGKSVADFSIAVQKRSKPSDGSPDADFFRVSCWDKTAEYVSNYLGKGRLVAVEGRLQSRKFTDSNNNAREVVEIVAHNVQSLERPRDDDSAKVSAAKRPEFAGVPQDEYDPFADE